MNFKKATDGLLSGVDQKTLAQALGVSVASVRQARLRPDAKAYRTAPEDWEGPVIRLAEEMVWHYQKLIERIRAERQEVSK